MPETDLMIVETMFCDNESDQDVLTDYFARFTHTLRSLVGQVVPSGLELLLTVYMSSEKRRWINHAWALIDRATLPSNLKVRIWEYDHPTGGYPAAQGIDRIKSPNKHAPYRDRLFQAAHSYVNYGAYRSLIRVAIDDDDIWLPAHAAELHRIARKARAEYPQAPVLALGPLNCMIGYVTEKGVDVDVVSMRRTLTGDKFYTLERPTAAAASTLSPWAVPEILDEPMAQRLQQREITLRFVKHNRPGFVYIRWGQNLSNHRKDYHVSHTYGSLQVDSVAALAKITNDHLPAVDDDFEFGTFGRKLEVRAARTADGTVNYSTNFEMLQLPEAQICFYLLQDGKRIDLRSYGTKGSGIFRDTPEDVSVKAFVRDSRGVFLREETSVV